MKLLNIFIFIALLFISCNNNSGEQVLTLQAGENGIANSPVYITLEGDRYDENSALCLHSADGTLPGQVETVSESEQRIWLIADAQPGTATEFTIRTDDACFDEVYSWESNNDESIILNFGNRPVVQYEHPVYDPEDVERTKKPFHHLFDPTGGQLITKGPGGLYSHHRGIYFGYNHVYTNDRQIDIWHARDGERSEHVEILKEFEGPVMGGHIVKIHWKNHDGEEFLEEEREIRVFRQSEDVFIVDFQSMLSTVNGPVRLDGDRQHAGVQFRAAQYVADHAEQTSFLRPGNLSHINPDEEIEGEDMMDMPWNAMQFVVEGNPYTVAYLSHPSNPGDAEMSERLYGRFGEFFRYEVTNENPLQVRYRFLVKSGSLTPDEIDRHYSVFGDETLN